MSTDKVCQTDEFPEFDSLLQKSNCVKCHSSCLECFGPRNSDCLKCDDKHVLLNGKCTFCLTNKGDLKSDLEIVNGKCQEICGKGKRLFSEIECDDGNLVDGANTDPLIEIFFGT